MILAMKNITILSLASLFLFSDFAIAENNTAEKINPVIFEKTPEWVINKMNEWMDSLKPPVLIKSTFNLSEKNTAPAIIGSADLYFLGRENNINWVVPTNYEKPAKYTCTVLKKKDSREEAYFPSLKQRVYRHDALENPSSLAKFLAKGAMDAYSYDEMESFAQSMRVENFEGTYILRTKVKPEESMKILGIADLAFHVRIDPEGRPLETAMLMGEMIAYNQFDAPQTNVDVQKIISKYITPALNAPLTDNTSFTEADTQAVNIATGNRKETTMWFDAKTGNSVGAILGSSIGIIIGCIWVPFSIFGILKCRFRGFVLNTAKTFIAIGILLLFTGGTALFLGQPYHVWYPFLLCGIVVSIQMPFFYIIFKKRYLESELKKMSIEDMK